ncbi:MAG: hypothetical protein J7L53_09385 [Deltaproteobacteria bacterium]|nr:hypothetical protein [Deltaproteobacteria bacterium]
MYNTVKLNSIDFLHLATNSVSLSHGNLITIRFKEFHDAIEIYDGMRYMLTIYPKLRSIVEPTLFSYNLKILEDNDERLNVLFNNSFHVVYSIKFDSPDYVKFRRDLYNEPFSLEQTIPIKIYYLPDDSKPILLISIHHVVGDGFSWIHMVGSLMSYLNGKKPSLLPLDNPSLTPALLENKWYKIPLQIYNSLKLYAQNIRKPENKAVIPATSHTVNFYGPVDMYHKTLSYNLTSIKSKTRELGCSITSLLLTALTISLSQDSKQRKGDIIRIGLSVDLRPYFTGKTPIFGNYLTGLTVDIPRKCLDNPKKILKEITSQMTYNLGLIKQKQIFLPVLIYKLFTIMGKKNYARGLRMVKKRRLIDRTFGLSNIGNVDHLNSHGPKAQIYDAISCAPSQGLLVVINSIEGHINTEISFQEAEFTRDEIKNLIKAFEKELGRLLEL